MTPGQCTSDRPSEFGHSDYLASDSRNISGLSVMGIDSYAPFRLNEFELMKWLSWWRRCGLLLVEILNADLERPQELQILSRDFKLHFTALQPTGSGFFALVRF